jgi:hypothetical protein
MSAFDVRFQFVDSPVEKSAPGGTVPADGLVDAFRAFPYAEEIQRARAMTSATFPTLIFRRQSDGEEIAIWSTDAEVFDLCFVKDGKKWFSNSRAKPEVESILARFATESLEAISPRGWWKKIFG